MVCILLHIKITEDNNNLQTIMNNIILIFIQDIVFTYNV